MKTSLTNISAQFFRPIYDNKWMSLKSLSTRS